MSKVAVVVFADSETHADMGRIANAIEIVKECAEAGDEARLLFDGAGVTWPGKLADSEHPLHSAFEAVRNNILGACSFCSKAFHSVEGVEKAGITFLDDYEGHPSIHSLIKDGYQIITV